MLAVISIALRVEWTLLLIGVVYVFETASVMLQVSYFKYTKRKYGEGRRIFRMTPFHHTSSWVVFQVRVTNGQSGRLMLSFGQLEHLQVPLPLDGSWKRYEINEKSRNALFLL